VPTTTGRREDASERRRQRGDERGCSASNESAGTARFVSPQR
jgi:hypothetical protein